ncbi:cytochrome P450 [Streptomyces sp. NBC_01451]|uniref:cytochrome P450 n=1 Tax=Streptomyces sp. NBC_01451 TaxID=2903872 RepID=UPI002E354ED3|nr:cytochrome P450 [Streptomyces sp. NBC_01451]
MTTPTEIPVTRTCPYAPPEEHLRLREQAPVSKVRLPNGHEVWVLTRHEDIRAMLADTRFSSDRTHPTFPTTNAQGHRHGNVKTSILSLDPPEHGPARRAVVGEFTVKRMNALRPRVQQIVDEHIDAMLAGPRPADLVQALSLPVPSLVICELLGVPYGDHDFFQTRATEMQRRTAPMEKRFACITELRSYLVELIARKEKEPGDDLLSRQLEKTSNRDDLVSLAFVLLIAGHETTANMISLSTLSFIEQPEFLAAIREDPAKTPNAVEELLRYFTIAEFANPRVAAEDIEFGGVIIRAGDGVIGLSNTGNRDPEVFDNPDELDVERGARHHLAFGYGPHQCLGQSLARLELEIVFDTLFRRVPGLRLAVPADELQFKDDATIYGLYELPVTW